MIRTLYTCKVRFNCFAAVSEGLNNKLNTIINNINSQISVIYMELLRKFNVKLVSRYKKNTITYYNLKKAIFDKSSGNLVEIIQNSYGLFMGRLARG